MGQLDDASPASPLPSELAADTDTANTEPAESSGQSLEQRMQNWRRPVEEVTDNNAKQPAPASPRIARRTDDAAMDATISTTGPRKTPLAELDPPSAAPAGPKLRVESMGPRSIALNTAATYTVAIHNDSDVEAHDVAVTIRVPAWAEIVSSRSNSALSRRVGKNAGGGLKWEIERVAPQGGLELVLQIVPRERRAFELAVDWTSAPPARSVVSSRRQPRSPNLLDTAAVPKPNIAPKTAVTPKSEESKPDEAGALATDAIARQEPMLSSPDLSPGPLPAAPLTSDDHSIPDRKLPLFESPALADAPATGSESLSPVETPKAAPPALLESPALQSDALAADQAPHAEPPQLAASPAPETAAPIAAAPEAIPEPRTLPSPLRSQPDKQLPQVELTISGPEEVRFGEEAVFKLTLKNTGKADAEEVEIRLLPTASGGEPIASHTIGTVRAGETQTAEIELVARDPGKLVIHAEAVTAGDHRFTGDKIVEVISTDLKVEIAGPAAESLGAVAVYQIHVTNSGKSAMNNVKVTVALPADARVASVSGADKRPSSSSEQIVAMLNKLAANQERVIELKCTFDQAGEHKLQATAEAAKLKHTGSLATLVQGAPDLVLDIVPPKGQIPIRSVAKYEVWIRNRGTGPAEGLQVVAFFSEGIEPVSASGAGHQVGPGQVVFHRVPKIKPGGELVLTVNAAAQDPGRHRFRAELYSKSPEITLAEETTARFGDARPTLAEQPGRHAKPTR